MALAQQPHSLAWLGILFFTGQARAMMEDGDDFSNNLFSDLAPLLALFGERVTLQFLSQSTGWADCIIFAMAPLGIITAVVSAIRVAGPGWLKAIIGRARENHVAAEIELMSSTSHETCELWNGQNVVRCPGRGSIWEFICVRAKADGERMPSKVTAMPLSQAIELGIMAKEHDDHSKSGVTAAPSSWRRIFNDPWNWWPLDQRPVVTEKHDVENVAADVPGPESRTSNVSSESTQSETSSSETRPPGLFPGEVVIIHNTDHEAPKPLAEQSRFDHFT